VVFKQIAGLLARRIVFNHKPGDTLARGQRVGLIKFGSRTDVIFPQPAEISVKAGDRVKGGSSILARIPVPQTPGSPPVRQPSEVVQ
jgi:phosphatidylserine decarboxylase